MTTTPAGGRGAPGRVAAVHRQTRRSLVVVVAFVVGAAVLAVADPGQGRWAALHLFLVGGLLGAVGAATQFLAVTWSSSPAPTDRRASAQRWLLAGGAVAVAASGRVEAPAWVVAVAVLPVLASLALLIASLLRIRRDATVDRFLPAIDAYVLAIVMGLAGSVLGALLLGDAVADQHRLRVREAHMAINVFGLIGIVVAGTLPYMAATQLRTKMSPRATPGAVGGIVTTLGVATLVAAIGHVTLDDRLASFGLMTYAVALAVMVRILPRAGRRQLEWAGPRALQLVSGVVWWIAMTAVLAWITYDGGDPSAARLALVVGGYAQILVAAMAYLGPVVRGGGHERLGAGFRTTRSWLAPLAGNVAAVAALAEARAALAMALGIWALDLLVRTAALLKR